jgi:hypothetical protein
MIPISLDAKDETKDLRIIVMYNNALGILIRLEL